MARIIRKALQTMKWPLLAGEVELCDVNLSPNCRNPVSIWLAIERRRPGEGLIRGWRGSINVREDFRRICPGLDPKASLITPPSGLYRELRNLGFRQRSEPLGAADALPAAAATAASFRQMLKGRRHHGLEAATVETYLGEFVFRHNAKVLGWSPARQRQRVMRLLRTTA